MTTTELGDIKEQPIVIAQGSKFELTIGVTTGGLPKNLSGWTAKMQIRPERQSTTLLDSFTSPSNHLTVVGVAGQILVDIPGSVTATYDDWTNAAYDLYIIDPTAEPYRILEGTVRVDHSVTV